MVEYKSSYEEERKKNKLSKKEQFHENESNEKEHEKGYTISHNKIELHELEDLIKEGIVNINEDMFNKIKEDNKIDDNEINIILESVEIKDIIKKIEEIENLLEQENILPKELKIQKQEFLEACKDKEKKNRLLKKIDIALDYVNTPLRTSGPKIGGNPLARSITIRENLLFLSNKKLIQAQENIIDIKNYLYDNT